jgi:hypothetical protein
MSLLIHASPNMLWHGIIQSAKADCDLNLSLDLEAYLISLLMRYTNKPEVVQQIFATAFLDALQSETTLRNASLKDVGDQCLLFAGLFPQAAERRHVKLIYFVDIGRSAYTAISNEANGLFSALALQFVPLMDILQSIRTHPQLLPLEAYEQWQDLGSKRALKILQSYTKGFPLK